MLLLGERNWHGPLYLFSMDYREEARKFDNDNTGAGIKALSEVVSRVRVLEVLRAEKAPEPSRVDIAGDTLAAWSRQ